MSMSSLRTAAAMIAVASLGMQGGATVIPRPSYGVGPALGSDDWDRSRRCGNNRPAGPTRAQKKRLRKIARASRRYNLRMGA